MDPRSEVLLRQPDYFQGNVLLVGLPPDDALGRLPNAHGWCWHAGDHAALEARFAGRVHFGVDVPERAFDTAVVYLPKSKELSDYVLKAVAARLPNADVFLVGEKKGGIEGASKQLIPFGKPRKLDSARHCQLWQVSVVNVPQAPVLAHLAQHYELALEEGPLNVVSLPGVFSHGRLDRGSALLLDNLDKLPSGHVLDFGCGAGVLGAAVKRRYPHNSVTLLDVDAFATASSRLTLAANGLEGEVICGDGIDAAPMELNTILSNPPFHVGVHTDYHATENLLQKAIKHLKKGGELRIVANSFLRYQPLIEEQFGACTVKAEGQGFRIYSAKRR
ncbi:MULTISPECIES: class I SAM-dependent methyltransferase [Pseudomonas]|uniref:Ribosomal RNA small subunit methyltransferase C n=1 Tax=Pseudomonas lundensis TaxID=86185 RepID=A0A266NBF6_9PSED|nr:MULTISPECIES: class I SAM-dependent methyltransferase [Pseudomonas]NMY36798.1 class I SAM-dependent methyltransferase [Pseudomonas sp. WS 5078]NMY59260.1 class I SAM-dependent methyltransferase [Pseudomonas sp. WS 5354]OZY59826.1 16S rRNA methyltransferase [Pseudomonas lundensis]